MYKVFFMFVCIHLPLFSFGSTLVGNGGDVVFCEPSPQNEFSGFYSYDFLATYNLANKNSDLAPIQTWDESKSRMNHIVLQFMDVYSDAFFDFTANIENYTNFQSQRIWKARPGDLIDVPNLPLFRTFPSNCNKVYQAVIRYRRGSKVIYEVNPWVIEQLKKTPMQFSFLMMHEFLWDVFETFPEGAVDAQSRLEFIRFIHSTDISKWTQKAVTDYLLSLGLDKKKLTEWRTHREKYSPRSIDTFNCTAQYPFDDPDTFTLRFQGLSYLGSNGGYFYDQVEIRESDGTLRTQLFARPAGTEGVYVFENRFSVMLHSENPNDGSFENNMSDNLTLQLGRGWGACRRVL